MLTKKDYVAIAEIIENEYNLFDDTGEDDTEGKHATRSIAGKLADYFEQDNSRFDRERFMKACGLKK